MFFSFLSLRFLMLFVLRSFVSLFFLFDLFFFSSLPLSIFTFVFVNPHFSHPSCSPVLGAAESVILIHALEDICFDDLPTPGTQALFECVLSHANCRVQWLRGGKPLEIGRKFEFTPEGCVYRLTVNDVTLDDLDTYSMVYKNLKTEANLDAKSGRF